MPVEHEVVVYCACPTEASAVKVAESCARLASSGFAPARRHRGLARAGLNSSGRVPAVDAGDVPMRWRSPQRGRLRFDRTRVRPRRTDAAQRTVADASARRPAHRTRASLTRISHARDGPPRMEIAPSQECMANPITEGDPGNDNPQASPHRRGTGRPDAALPGAAAAQDAKWIVGLRALGIYPDDSSSISGLAVKDQWTGELDFTYFFTRNIAAELILGWAKHEVTLNGTSLAGRRPAAHGDDTVPLHRPRRVQALRRHRRQLHVLLRERARERHAQHQDNGWGGALQVGTTTCWTRTGR